ncbi:MAG TPA: sulfotransferase [Caulobacteraceae bacterium]|nr:sulfotransferase [Caulobacteraceae bacterium]
MALEIVGSGLGRTGTYSMKLALEKLGFGPCHHMAEVFAHPETVSLWIAAGQGRPDWEAVFSGYRSMVDYPGAAYWRELADYYPNAKVLHTVRDPDAWFDSTQATILAPGSIADNPPPQMAAFFEPIRRSIGGDIHNRETMVGYFRRHSEEVERAIAPERLLVYESGEGWERLCAFLGVPVPDEPFPRENTREAFIGRAATIQSELAKQVAQGAKA